jgi:hypothetical protein
LSPPTRPAAPTAHEDRPDTLLASTIFLMSAYAREGGSRRLAQVVMATGDARMRDARWGHYVWVRLQGAGAGFDLLLDRAPEARSEGAGPWQAATTSR